MMFAVPVPFPPLLVTVEVSLIASLSPGARLVTQEKLAALRGLVWLQPGCGYTCGAVDRDVQQGEEGQKSTGGTPCALLCPCCSVICPRVPACLSWCLSACYRVGRNGLCVTLISFPHC
uniref:Uncharacterized protein n=1 Tax=Chromera velia CCMP2878 TaxID=1169474 RepID=A0A0G4F065_9ALVE|eukprot:Cvel_14391.t1-p1 / transcript=Cvel_14391.t1 / gene=Cvel_14391 / organism=Chromera_velia_CCMP2878 / gene_product=hypothetical protein / transcript_product=hypothetical protein / location=Cvel_scaffold1021:32844-33197(+) / protein_length=118 / sequence_SO=supercontig / SO=protein_coding / is_pseudo=false